MKSLLPTLSLSVILGLSALCARGEILKLVSYDLPAGKDVIARAAEQIGPEEPDVILLQSARSWNTCLMLAKALEPAEYSVLTCSSFGAEFGRNPKEVAVLAKRKALYAWNERSGTNSPATGFSFVSIPVGSHRVGLFSVQTGKGTQAVVVAEALIRQSKISEKWKTNAPDFFVAMSSTKSMPGKANAALRQAFAASNFGLAEGIDSPQFLYVRPAGARFRFKDTGSTNAIMVIAELDPDAPVIPPKVAKAAPVPKKGPPKTAAKSAPQRADLADGKTPAVTGPKTAPVETNAAAASANPRPVQVSAPSNSTASKSDADLSRGFWIASAALAGAMLAFSVVWLKRRLSCKQETPHALPKAIVGNGPYVVISPGSVTASGEAPAFSGRIVHLESREIIRTESAVLPLSHSGEQPELRKGLLEWLKREFVARLVKDRSRLMAEQAAAAVSAADAGNRLARLEQRIAAQNHAFQLRIEELTRELGQAREENRELIRMRIIEIRKDMEEARARLLRESEDQP